MRYSIALFLLIKYSFLVNSQAPDSTNHYSIGIQAHYGFIIPHSAAIAPVSKTNPYSFEISLNNLKTSYESWSVFNRYNISGIQFNYFNFQNPEILGSAYLLTVFTEPVLSYGNRFRFSVKGGAGLSYHTKIFKFEKNELNKFFSTSISFPLYLSARIKYSINESANLILSGTYNHISNGAMRIPNYGMNFPTVAAGLEYFPKKNPHLDRSVTPQLIKKVSGRYLLVQVLSGYKVVWGVDTYSFGVSTRYTWQLRARYALNAGAELIFDGGVKKYLEIHGLNLDYKRFAITGGQDFLLGKAVFTQYLGVYVYSPYKAKHPVYQKYELSYKILPSFMVGVYLKAHTSDAELFGFSLNYMLQL
jgi:hypothetical protein